MRNVNILIAFYNVLTLGLFWQYLELKNQFDIYKARVEALEKQQATEVHDKAFSLEPTIIIYLVGGFIILGLTIYSVNLGINIVQNSFAGRLYKLTNERTVSLLDWWTDTIPVDCTNTAVDLPGMIVNAPPVDHSTPDSILTFVELTDYFSVWGCG